MYNRQTKENVLGARKPKRGRRPGGAAEAVSDVHAAFGHFERAPQPPVFPVEGRAGAAGQAAQLEAHPQAQAAVGDANLASKRAHRPQQPCRRAHRPSLPIKDKEGFAARGRICPETGWGLGKRMAFRHLSRIPKTQRSRRFAMRSRLQAHQWRWALPVAPAAWFRRDRLFADLRFPDFAGMTGRYRKRRRSDSPAEFDADLLPASRFHGDDSVEISRSAFVRTPPETAFCEFSEFPAKHGHSRILAVISIWGANPRQQRLGGLA